MTTAGQQGASELSACWHFANASRAVVKLSDWDPWVSVRKSAFMTWDIPEEEFQSPCFLSVNELWSLHPRLACAPWLLPGVPAVFPRSTV